MSDPVNRLEERFDALLHLMDRQLIDVEGRLLGKVDDLELTPHGEAWEVTALLTGPAALLGRLGGRIGDALVTRWEQMRPSEPHRTWPWRLEMHLVDHVDSAVHLTVRREGVLRRDRPSLRLGTLAGMTVVQPDGRQVGRVIDVRVEPDADGALVLRSLLVGRGGPGSLLGYDRHRDQGPRVVAAAVRLWHRDTRVVDIGSAAIDWETQQVRLEGPLAALGTHALGG